MRAIAAFIVSLCLVGFVAGAEFQPYAGPKPIAVLIQTDPWLLMMGSDTPRVAIYEDGTVIFAKRVDKRLAYHRGTLDKAGLKKVREQIDAVLSRSDVRASYNIRPNATDQSEAKFYLSDGRKQMTTTVYGLMAPNTELPGYTQFPRGTKARIPPRQVFALHRWICSLDIADSKEWTPSYVEVMFWDDSPEASETTDWPKGWPALDSPRAVKRGDQYSVFLDGSSLPEFRKFRESRPGRVAISGKKMSMSYRLAFPSEPIWQEAFAERKK